MRQEMIICSKNLTYLTVPQELLLGQSYGTALQTHATPAIQKFLPSSLKGIKLLCPTVHVYDWPDEVLDNKAHLMSLTSVGLECDPNRNELIPPMLSTGDIWLEDRQVWFVLDVYSYFGDGYGRPDL
jgi:hypothetical protein